MEEKIVEMAERLGFEAARIWPDIVAITWITSMFWSVAGLIILILLFIALYYVVTYCARNVRRINRERERETDPYKSYIRDSDPAGFVIAGSAVSFVIVIAILMVLTDLPKNIAGVFYPEARTVLDLAKALR